MSRLSAVLLAIAAAAVIALSGPVSGALLRAVGADAPVEFWSLSIDDPLAAAAGVRTGDAVSVTIGNHSPSQRTARLVIAAGSFSVSRDVLVAAGDAKSEVVSVPAEAASGRLSISIDGTQVAVSVTVSK
jgi:hypothetical protein